MQRRVAKHRKGEREGGGGGYKEREGGRKTKRGREREISSAYGNIISLESVDATFMYTLKKKKKD